MEARKVPEKTDYPALALGYPPVSCRNVLIAGFVANVYGVEEIRASTLPIAAVVATHGRMNNQHQMRYFAYGLLGQIRHLSAGQDKRHDVILVTIDQRNHGDRTVDRNANLAYDANPNHLIDMASGIVGGCQDVSMIIDFLACYLFPNGERVIDEWVATGISLGGNLTWRLLQVEPRIRIAIPIIGLPFTSFARYLGARAASLGLPFAPPIYPPSLRPLLESPPPDGCYTDKRILSIHGQADKLVPFEHGLEDIRRVFDEGGAKGEVWVQDRVGHVVTGEMMRKTAEWVWRWALSADPPSQTSQL